MTNVEFLTALRSENQLLMTFAEQLREVPERSLNRPPTYGGWNVTQCLDHMNRATELYLNQIEGKLEQLRPVSKPYYKASFLAAYAIKSQEPTDTGVIKNKMKTLKAFVPEGELRPYEVLVRFRENLSRFEVLVDLLETKDLRSFKVTTALGPILKFYIGDALRFVHAHNRRHMLQANRILDNTNALTSVTG